MNLQSARPAPPPTSAEAVVADSFTNQRRERTRAIRRVFLVVLGLNLLVASLKLFFGWLTGSIALIADGVHSLLDASANLVGLVGIAVASRPPDEEHPYGHERYETLASMAIAVLMGVGVVEIVRNAIDRLQTGAAPEVTWLSFAVLGVTLTINSGVTLWERREGRRLQSDLLRADAKHTASDVLVSLGVIVGLAGVRLGMSAADAIVSLAIAAAIAWAAWQIIREASLVLTDAVIGDPHALLQAILTTPGVVTAHNLRARSSGGRLWVEVHVTVDPHLRVRQAHEVATAVEQGVREIAGPLTEVIVHVEPAEPPHTRPDALFGRGASDEGSGGGMNR